MAKRTSQRVKSATPAPKPLTPPERLTRSQIAHEFGRIGDKYTVAEMSRRTTIPQSTLRSWIKKGQVSKRGLERSRRALPKARGIRRAVTPAEIKRRQQRKAQKQRETVSRTNAASATHLAFATGINPILTGSKLKQPSFDKIASAIARASPLPTSPRITGVRLDAIRLAAFDEHTQLKGTAQANGTDYRTTLAPTDAGQAELSEAWIRELGWAFEHAEHRPNFIEPYSPELVANYNQRNVHTDTGDASSMWEMVSWCLKIPVGYFAITYEPPGADVYEVKIWVIDSTKKRNRKKKQSAPSQLALPNAG